MGDLFNTLGHLTLIWVNGENVIVCQTPVRSTTTTNALNLTNGKRHFEM